MEPLFSKRFQKSSFFEESFLAFGLMVRADENIASPPFKIKAPPPHPEAFEAKRALVRA
jgi:hypothetical protein